MMMADVAHPVAVMHGRMDANPDIDGSSICSAGTENGPCAQGKGKGGDG
jgi:hypothetical protein